jgi:hypothetical protein
MLCRMLGQEAARMGRAQSNGGGVDGAEASPDSSSDGSEATPAAPFGGVFGYEVSLIH